MASKPVQKRTFIQRAKESVKAGVTTVVQFFQGESHYPFKMLLIGETGSGKTSFLNLLANCGMVQALGCDFGPETLQRFKNFNDIKLENAQSISMESKTDDAKLYNVEVGELKVGIIDSPGFGDSRGLKQDEKNSQRIIDALRKENYINCVCLIINGRQARTSASLKYVLTEITAILPREILENVIVVFSNTADPLDLNFDPTSLTTYFGREIDPKHQFCVENPYCKFEKAKAKVNQVGIDRVAKSLQKSFEDTSEVLDEMCCTIKDFPRVHTLRFLELYDKKKKIEGNVLCLVTAYDNQVRAEKAIKNCKEEVDAAVKSKTLNSDFRTKQHFEKWDVEKTSRHNTLCSYKGCYGNCHVPCYLPKSVNKEVFRGCGAMGGPNDTCRKCGHGYIYHHHDETLFKLNIIDEDIVDEEMEAKFKTAKSDQERAQLLYKKLETEKLAAEAEKKRLSKEPLEQINEFEQLGVARNYSKLIENQLAVIETRLQGTTGTESADLRKTKEELETKLKLVKETKSAQQV